MGTFDYVKCDYPLPDPMLQDAVFQTKSFQMFPNMDYLRIAEDGELWVMKYRDAHRSHRPPHKTSWSGELYFCVYTTQDEYVDYKAVFAEGNLISLNAHKRESYSVR